MFIFKQSRTELEGIPRLDSFTRSKDFTPSQQKHVKKLFTSLVFDLLALVVSTAGAVFLDDLFFAILGIVSGVLAVRSIIAYHRIVTGEGIRTVFLFFDKFIRVVSVNFSVEASYSKIKRATVDEKGLTITFADGKYVIANPASLTDCEDTAAILYLLTHKLGRRMVNVLESPEYRAQTAKHVAEEEEYRFKQLGIRLTETAYGLTSADKRAYCRLKFSSRRSKAVLSVFYQLTAALATGAGIAGVILSEAMFSVIMYMLAALLGGVLLLTKVGLPIFGRFRAENDDTLAVYIHYDGVCAAGTFGTVCARWQDVLYAHFDESDGISFDLKDGMAVYFPAEALTEEMVIAVRDRYEKATSDKNEG